MITKIDPTLPKNSEEAWRAAAAVAYETDPIGCTIPELSKLMRSETMEKAMKKMGATNTRILIGTEKGNRFVIDEIGLSVLLPNGRRMHVSSRMFIEVFCSDNSASHKDYRHPECLVPFIKQAAAQILESPAE